MICVNVSMAGCFIVELIILKNAFSTSSSSPHKFLPSFLVIIVSRCGWSTELASKSANLILAYLQMQPCQWKIYLKVKMCMNCTEWGLHMRLFKKYMKMPTRHEYFSGKDFFRLKTMEIEVPALIHTCTLRMKNCRRDFSLKGFVLHFVCLSRVCWLLCTWDYARRRLHVDGKS